MRFNIQDPRGPLTLGSDESATWRLVLIAALLIAFVLLAASGVGCAPTSEIKPAQAVTPVVAPSAAGTGNITTTTVDTTSSQHSEQTTAGTAVHGAVNQFTQNTGMTPLGLAISIVLGCWVIAAFFFGIVAKIEVQGAMANVVCWIGVLVFGVVLPALVYAVATGRI